MKVAQRTVLRWLIVAEIGFGLASMAANGLLFHRVPAEIRECYSSVLRAKPTLVQIIADGLASLDFVVLAIAWIGLWRLWKPARLLYTLSYILGGPLIVFGATFGVWTSLSTLFSEYSAVATGMILSLIYFSDLSVHFSNAETPKAEGKGQALFPSEIGDR